MNQVRRLAESESAAGLSPLDLIHLSVMLNNAIDMVATTDCAITRVDLIKVYSTWRNTSVKKNNDHNRNSADGGGAK